MTKLLAINSGGHSKKAGLTYDLSALSHNAKLCFSIAQRNNFSMRVVLKGGYLKPSIVGRLVQIPEITFSSGEADIMALSSLEGRDVATLYPGQHSNSNLCSAYCRTTETTLDGFERATRFGRVSSVIVPILTEENREGLHPSEILPFMDRLEERFGSQVAVAGFQINFGCLRDVVPRTIVVQSLIDDVAKASIVARLARSPVLSIGGSVILPLLDKLKIPDAYRPELRIGEAVVSGTIPGEGCCMGLQPTASFRVRKVQDLKGAPDGQARVLLSIGTNILDQDAVGRGYEGFRFESLSSEVSVALVEPGCVVHNTSVTGVPLNYAETERALSRLTSNFVSRTGSEPVR